MKEMKLTIGKYTNAIYYTKNEDGLFEIKGGEFPLFKNFDYYINTMYDMNPSVEYFVTEKELEQVFHKVVKLIHKAYTDAALHHLDTITRGINE